MKQYTLIIIILTTLLAGCGYQQANERIDSLYVQGDRYLNNDQWDSAMIVFSEAERLLNPQTDLVMRGRVYAILGYLWKINSNIPKAIEYQEKAWQAYDKAGNEDLSVLTLLNLADYYIKTKSPDRKEKSLEYIERTKACKNLNDTIRGAILQQKALCYHFAHQNDSAIFYFHLAFSYPDETQYKCINRLYLGISHYKLEQLDSAKLYVTEALTYPAGFRQRSGCHNMLRKIAEAQGDSAAYNYYATMSIAYKDSTMRKENSLSYETTAMDDKVDALQDKKHRRQMTFIAIALALVVIVALMVYILRTKYHQKQIEEWQNAMQEAQQVHENSRNERVEQHIARLQQLYSPTSNWQEKQWKQIFRDIQLQNDSFFSNLQKKHPTLTQEDIRLCVLIILDFTYSEIAICMNLAVSTIGKAKQRLAKKMQLSVANLRDYLLQQYY